MRMIASAFVIGLGALAFAMPAFAVQDHCVFVSTISGFNVIDDETLIIHSGRDAYRVNLFGSCFGLRNAETIGIDSRDGMLCWPSNNHIIFRDSGMTQRCPVDSVIKMAPEDFEKLKAGKNKPASDKDAPAAAPAP